MDLPTERELEVLKLLWKQGEATVRELWQAMGVAHGSQATPYTTVLSLLQVMTRKGLVRHRREGRRYVYRANLERDTALGALSSEFLERVFDGALGEWLETALNSKSYRKKELKRLKVALTSAIKHDRKKGDHGCRE